MKFLHHRSRAVLALCCAVAMRDRALQESDPDEQRHGELFVEVRRRKGCQEWERFKFELMSLVCGHAFGGVLPSAV